jgi:hypothetical protein
VTPAQIPGLRLKIRDQGEFIVAALWLDGEQKEVVALLAKAYAEASGGPGSEPVQAWFRAVEQLFAKRLSSITGTEVTTKRRKARS